MKLTKREEWLMEFAFDQGFNSSGTFGTFMDRNPDALDLVADEIPAPEIHLGHDCEYWRQMEMAFHVVDPKWSRIISAFVRGDKVSQMYGNEGFPQESLTFSGDLADYRIDPKVKMITVNGFEVPAGFEHHPNVERLYFLPGPSQDAYYDSRRWQGNSIDLRIFDRGLIYLNKEDAIKRAKAMLGVDPNE